MSSLIDAPSDSMAAPVAAEGRGKPLTFISLFSGVGGLDLGLERAGMKCIAQVEISPHLRERVFLVAYPAGEGPQGQEPAGRIWGRGLLAQRDWWPTEPAVSRLGHGVSNRVERTVAAGNAVSPVVAEWIGRRIVAAESEASHA